MHICDDEPLKGKKRGTTRDAPKFDLPTLLFKMCGVDLTRIDGIDVTTALAVIGETGAGTAQIKTLFALSNLWMARRQLMAIKP